MGFGGDRGLLDNVFISQVNFWFVCVVSVRMFIDQFFGEMQDEVIVVDVEGYLFFRFLILKQKRVRIFF